MSARPILVLLPGLDGTGDLFTWLVKCIGDEFNTLVVRYPTDELLTSAQLRQRISDSTPTTEPFWLVAESFSTPLAIQFAANARSNMVGLILCAGFATAPRKGLIRIFVDLLAPIAVRLTPPTSVIRWFLFGSFGSVELAEAVRSATSRVRSSLLALRVRQALRTDARSELAAVACPVLYIRASEDRVVPETSSKEILRLRPETSIAVLNGPHLILQTRPAEAILTIKNFIATLS